MEISNQKVVSDLIKNLLIYTDKVLKNYFKILKYIFCWLREQWRNVVFLFCPRRRIPDKFPPARTYQLWCSLSFLSSDIRTALRTRSICKGEKSVVRFERFTWIRMCYSGGEKHPSGGCLCDMITLYIYAFPVLVVLHFSIYRAMLY